MLHQRDHQEHAPGSQTEFIQGIKDTSEGLKQARSRARGVIAAKRQRQSDDLTIPAGPAV